MEEGRIIPNVFKKKPRLILDNRFPFVFDLSAGDKGQIKATMTVEAERLEMDHDGTERKRIRLLLQKAELIQVKGTRL